MLRAIWTEPSPVTPAELLHLGWKLYGKQNHLWWFLAVGFCYHMVVQRVIQILLSLTKLRVSSVLLFGFFSLVLTRVKHITAQLCKIHQAGRQRRLTGSQISTYFWKAKSELWRLFQTYSSPSKAKIAACLENQVMTPKKKKKGKK